MGYCQIQRNFRVVNIYALLCKFYTFFLDKICKLLTYHTPLSTNHGKVINIQKWSVFLAHPVYATAVPDDDCHCQKKYILNFGLHIIMKFNEDGGVECECCWLGQSLNGRIKSTGVANL